MRAPDPVRGSGSDRRPEAAAAAADVDSPSSTSIKRRRSTSDGSAAVAVVDEIPQGEARRAPAEEIARAFAMGGGAGATWPDDDAALFLAADSARAAAGASRCLILGPSSDPGAPSLLAASPRAAAAAADSAAAVAVAAEAWRELALGRWTRGAAALGAPVAAGGLVVGALLLLFEGWSGRSGREWGERECGAAAAAAWALFPALFARQQSPKQRRQAAAEQTTAPAGGRWIPTRPDREVEQENAVLQRELQERELISRLVAEINDGDGRALDSCAELLAICLRSERARRLGTRFSDETVQLCLRLCESSPGGVFTWHGLERVPPELRGALESHSCMTAFARFESAVNAIIVVEDTDTVAGWGAQESRFLRLVTDSCGLVRLQSSSAKV
eukprot:tig00000042_g15451.t1